VEFWTADPVDEAWTVNPSGFTYQTFSFLTGHPPDSQQTIGGYTALYPQRVFGDFDGTPDGFVQAWGEVYGKPTADFLVSVYVNSILLPPVGSVLIKATTGVFIFSTVSGLPIDLDAGDLLLFVAPVATDATIYNFAWTIPMLNLEFVDVGVLGAGGGGGGGGGGDVNGPGSSTAGHFALWANNAGTLLSDGGGSPGALAFLNVITASYITDFSNAMYAVLTSMLVGSGSVTITPNGGAHTLTFTASGGGGGITGPGSSTNGEIVLFSGASGNVVTNSGCVPSTDAKTFLAAANFAAMRAALGIGTAGTQNTGTSGANVPLLSGANTWSAAQTFTLAPVFSDQPGSRAALGLTLGTSGATVPLLSTANTWSLAQTFTVAPIFTDQSGTRAALSLGSAAQSATTDFEPAGAYSNINHQTGTTYTLVLADKGELVAMDNGSANTLTIPTNASVAFPVNTRIDLSQDGAGQTTIAVAGGVTLNSAGAATKLRAQWSGASLIKRATNTWQLVGDITV
jgi:hypothetical protein